MKSCWLLLFLLVASVDTTAQFKQMPWSTVSRKELDMKTYPGDTTASAVVLNEIGQAFIGIDERRLFFRYYAKIKILTKNGQRDGSFTIPLYKNGNYREQIRDIKVTTYSSVAGSMQVTNMDAGAIYLEKNDDFELSKFAAPDVREGSVIEVQYAIESPFWFTFRTWEFQSHLPKVHSEYNALIPGTCNYAINLRGFLKLTVNSSKIEPKCYTAGGYSWDCARNQYAIDNVPAFKEEVDMTAKKNFLSAIYFELIELRDFDGSVHKYTRDWKDVDKDLQQESNFGRQVKKARSVLSQDVKRLTANEADPLKKATLIDGFIKSWYLWNGENRAFTDDGVKEVYESKKGNSADINLSLVGALQEAGLEAYPVMLSTRENGAVTELHPVLTEFNYVVASVTIAGTQYLMDGTDPLLPFGILPVRCMNEKGRLIGKESSWVSLTYKQKFKRSISVDLVMDNSGNIEGKLMVTEGGYSAVNRRGDIANAGSVENYIKELQKEWGDVALGGIQIENQNDVDKPLVMKFDVKLKDESTLDAKTIYLDPFVVDRLKTNPYASTERNYPIDISAPREYVYTFSITFPESIIVEETPKSTALSLPANGGRYVFSATTLGNKISIVSNLYLNKAVYNSAEYHYVRELYARMLQLQQSQIVLKRKG